MGHAIHGDLAFDAFRAPAALYFVSHFHSDHVEGLGPRWKRGPLVCSAPTARALRELTGVTAPITEIAPTETLRLDGFEVTAIDAHHIPGSLMFHVRRGGERVLYSGDFRLAPDHRAVLPDFAGVDALYLDDTYWDPRYVFPPRDEAISAVLDLIDGAPDRDVYLGLYAPGKVPLVSAICRRYKTRVYTAEAIHDAFRAVGMGHLVTRERGETRFVGYSRGYLEGRFLEYRKFDPARHLVILPTGWALDGGAHPAYYYVAYSDHADAREARLVIEMLRPGRTVGINSGKPLR